MEYNRQELIQLIDQAFGNYQANETLQDAIQIRDWETLQKLQALLKEPNVMSALLILWNSIASDVQMPGLRDRDMQVLATADQYPLTYLDLSARTRNALSHCQKLRTIGDLFRMSDVEIARIRGIGPYSKAMEEIRTSRVKFIQDFQDGGIR